MPRIASLEFVAGALRSLIKLFEAVKLTSPAALAQVIPFTTALKGAASVPFWAKLKIWFLVAVTVVPPWIIIPVVTGVVVPPVPAKPLMLFPVMLTKAPLCNCIPVTNGFAVTAVDDSKLMVFPVTSAFVTPDPCNCIPTMLAPVLVRLLIGLLLMFASTLAVEANIPTMFPEDVLEPMLFVEIVEFAMVEFITVMVPRVLVKPLIVLPDTVDLVPVPTFIAVIVPPPAVMVFIVFPETVLPAARPVPEIFMTVTPASVFVIFVNVLLLTVLVLAPISVLDQPDIVAFTKLMLEKLLLFWVIVVPVAFEVALEL